MKNKLFVFFICCCLTFSAQAQTGLYMRTQFWGSQLDVSWLYFTADKKLIRSPKFGVNPVQIQKELTENKSNVATCSLIGNKMNLIWGDGKKQSVNVEFSSGKLSGFDGGVCTQASPFSFKYFQDKTYTGLASFGSVSRSVTFFLGKDGKFTTDRLGAVSGSGNTSGAAAATGKESGTYSIAGNTIIFKYASGAEWRVIAQPYDLGKQEIIINDQLFKLK